MAARTEHGTCLVGGHALDELDGRRSAGGPSRQIGGPRFPGRATPTRTYCSSASPWTPGACRRRRVGSGRGEREGELGAHRHPPARRPRCHRERRASPAPRRPPRWSRPRRSAPTSLTITPSAITVAPDRSDRSTTRPPGRRRARSRAAPATVKGRERSRWLPGSEPAAVEQVAFAEHRHRLELDPGDAADDSVGPVCWHCRDTVGQSCCHRAQVLAAHRRPGHDLAVTTTKRSSGGVTPPGGRPGRRPPRGDEDAADDAPARREPAPCAVRSTRPWRPDTDPCRRCRRSASEAASVRTCVRDRPTWSRLPVPPAGIRESGVPASVDPSELEGINTSKDVKQLHRA